MAFPSHLLTDVIVVSRFIGRGTDAFATPTYGPKEQVRCSFQESFQKVRDSDGNERVSASIVVTEARIAIEDRVWLPKTNGAVPDSSVDTDAVKPIAMRNDRSRIRGFRLYQTFF